MDSTYLDSAKFSPNHNIRNLPTCVGHIDECSLQPDDAVRVNQNDGAGPAPGKTHFFIGQAAPGVGHRSSLELSDLERIYHSVGGTDRSEGVSFESDSGVS